MGTSTHTKLVFLLCLVVGLSAVKVTEMYRASDAADDSVLAPTPVAEYFPGGGLKDETLPVSWKAETSQAVTTDQSLASSQVQSASNTESAAKTETSADSEVLAKARAWTELQALLKAQADAQAAARAQAEAQAAAVAQAELATWERASAVLKGFALADQQAVEELTALTRAGLHVSVDNKSSKNSSDADVQAWGAVLHLEGARVAKLTTTVPSTGERVSDDWVFLEADSPAARAANTAAMAPLFLGPNGSIWRSMRGCVKVFGALCHAGFFGPLHSGMHHAAAAVLSAQPRPSVSAVLSANAHADMSNSASGQWFGGGSSLSLGSSLGNNVGNAVMNSLFGGGSSGGGISGIGGIGGIGGGGDDSYVPPPPAANATGGAAPAGNSPGGGDVIPPSPPFVPPVPQLARYAMCMGCIQSMEAMVAGATMPDACSKVNGTDYQSVCGYLATSGLTDYFTAQISANFDPFNICAAVLLCDLGDAAVLNAAVTPLLGVPYVLATNPPAAGAPPK